MSKDITKSTLAGLLWTSLGTGAQYVLQLAVMLVLARLLTPVDFGLAAAALVVVGFSAIFSQLGIGPAVVQRLELRPAHVRSAFTISVLLGLLLGAVTWLTAPAVAVLFHIDGMAPLTRTLALVFPLQGLSVVAESLLQRELRFRWLAGLEVGTVALGYGAVGVSMALLGYGPWALVGAQVAQTALKTVLLLIVRPHAIRPLIDRGAWRDLLYYGGGFTAARISNYFAGQGDNFVVARWLGAGALGVYGRAYQLMAGPAVFFGNVLDRVLFPALSQVQHDPERLAEAYRRGTALIALVMLPASAVLVVLAPELVGVLLGREWREVIVPLQVLGVGMLFRTSCKMSDSLVRATGEVYGRMWRQAVYAVSVVAGSWLGLPWGLPGVAVAVLGTLGLNFFLMAHLSLRVVGMSWRSYGGAHLPGLALAIVVGAVVWPMATALRAWGLAPLPLLVICAGAAVPPLVLAVSLPRLFLGPDGRWMLRKLTAYGLEEWRRTPRPREAVS